MLSYVQGKYNHPGPMLHVWEILAVIWSSSRKTWSEKSDVTQDLITDIALSQLQLPEFVPVPALLYPDQPTLSTILPNITFITAQTIEQNAPIEEWLFEMQNAEVFANGLCRELYNLLTGLEENHPVSSFLIPNALDYYSMCSSSSELFNKCLLTSRYFTRFVQKLSLLQDPVLPDDNQIRNNIIVAFLRLLLISAKYQRQAQTMAAPPFTDVLQKFTSHKQPDIQFFSFAVLSQIACQGYITTESINRHVECVENLQQVAIPLLRMYSLYEEFTGLTPSTILTPDIILQYLIDLAWNDNNKVLIFSLFSNFCLGEVVYVPCCNRSKALPWEVNTIKNTVLLSWMLAMNKDNAESIGKDRILMDVLYSICKDSESEIKDDAYCALLEITGKRHYTTKDSEQVGPFDVALMSFNKEEQSAIRVNV
ncbi:uncharacterized protein [Ptychodera flava]|uniref:uncharacterized protein isoform X1 n=1 Tax=Ptychodera flava TaxID=63121 RepID=UPI00396A930A